MIFFVYNRFFEQLQENKRQVQRNPFTPQPFPLISPIINILQ